METNSQEILNEYLSQHKISSCVDIVDFYKVFVELEVSNVTELANSVKKFEDFLLSHIDSIKTDDISSHFRLPKTIEKSISILNKKTSGILSPEQTVYADIVSKLAGSHKSAKILDVGPGKIPVSSILLGEKHDSVTAMDSYFEISTPTLKKLNVTPLAEYFKRTTSVETYDFVAGNKPCSAIEAIVEACSKANKPYYIELCDCELPHKLKVEDRLKYPAMGWETILPEIDRSVKFNGPIAYNLDATPAQIDKLRDELLITSRGKVLDLARRPVVSFFKADFSGVEWTKEPATDEIPMEPEQAGIDEIKPCTTQEKPDSLLDDIMLELQEH